MRPCGTLTIYIWLRQVCMEPNLGMSGDWPTCAGGPDPSQSYTGCGTVRSASSDPG